MDIEVLRLIEKAQRAIKQVEDVLAKTSRAISHSYGEDQRELVIGVLFEIQKPCVRASVALLEAVFELNKNDG